MKFRDQPSNFEELVRPAIFSWGNKEYGLLERADLLVICKVIVDEKPD